MAIAGTYGRGQMLGAGVDPSLFKQDYSGFAKAGEIQGQAYADLGKSIGSAITGFADIKKQTSILNAQSKGAESYLNSAKTLLGDKVPGLTGQIDGLLAMANDPAVSPYEKAALLSSGRQSLSDLTDLYLQREKIGMMQQAQAQSMSGTGENNWNAGLAAPQ
jgi:hypothetical protein